MIITWIGHSCFKIESGGFTVITDPYGLLTVPGLKTLKEKADQVLVSHEHRDHNARIQVKLIGGKESPFTITEIDTYHDPDKGAKRGPNKIFILDDGEFRVAHLGDLGCELEPGQIEQLKGLDAVMIPVGGFYTIDAAQAAELIAKISPEYVIPMHFRDAKAGFGFDVIAEAGDFTQRMKAVEYSEGSTFILPGNRGAKVPGEPQVIVLKPRNAKQD